MRNARLILLLALVCMTVPWLGETLFNTKGEPREAIVAVSMLQSGDWVLPVSYGADIPYKPPFLAWLIALFSWIFNGGAVNEFTSRLPSALAAIAMIMAGYSWAKRYALPNAEGYESLPWLMAAVAASAFEVFRSSVSSRVDMVLTACIVVALYQMYAWRESHKNAWKSLARLAFISLLLSGATLSKGPVGSLLPCLAMGIYCLLRGDNFFKTVGWLTAVCLASWILPAIWYVKAYAVGGDEFLNLAMEENIGRLTGKMSYDSHVNGWYYNIYGILSGMLPWTLMALMALCSACNRRAIEAIKSWRPVAAFRRLSNPSAFALVVAAVIFIFYCIPSSKRTVYLLPMYPFMAYGMALLALRLRDRWPVKAYAKIIFFIAIFAPVIALALQWAPQGIASKLEAVPLWRYPLALLPCAAGIISLSARKHTLKYLTFTTMSLILAYNAVFMPMVLNPKSDIKALHAVSEAATADDITYSYISTRLMRYYTLNFYLGDKMRRIEDVDPAQMQGKDFSVLVSDEDFDQLRQLYPTHQADTTKILARSCDTRRPVVIVRFRQ